jgi:DNA-binding winged helix-turn-helix (wHTH) protein/tetratricopeptide (TPR) repeat protein
MPQTVFRFSDFVFDSATGTLTRKNRDARLPEQTARLLQILLERSNALATREEIERALWPDEDYVNHDQGINVAVNRLRQFLRDDPKKPQFLHTIPKRGYSFCGVVEVVAEAGPATVQELPVRALPEDVGGAAAEWQPAAQAAPELTAGYRARSPAAWWMLGVCIVAIMAMAGLAGKRWFWKPRPVDHTLRVGIAPLRSANDRQDIDAAESFRLELSDAMARVPGVQVPATAAFVSSDVADISRTAERLSLDDLLLGSLSKQGDQYDLKFELVRPTDATHLASFEYSGPRNEFPAICDRLQQDVFHYMRSHAASLQVSKGSTNDPQAYEAYLQGNYHMLERNPDSQRRSIADFTKATTLDPEFAAAYAGMAAAYLRLSEYDTDPRNGLLAKAEDLARQAVKLDPLLARAHAVLGSTEYKHDKNFSSGESELREAIRIDPNEAAYRNWLSVLLVEEGRFDEAIEQLEVAKDRAPFWPSVYAMEGLVGVYARREAFAIKAARHYVDLLPNLPIAHNTMAWVYFDTRHYEEAIGEWRQMALLQNDPTRVRLEERGLEALRSGGTHAYAELRLAAIGEKGAGQVNDFNPAEWSACAGRRKQALDELERLATANDPFILHVGVDPLFDSFHHDPRFVSILARSGVTVPAALSSVQSGLCQ